MKKYTDYINKEDIAWLYEDVTLITEVYGYGPDKFSTFGVTINGDGYGIGLSGTNDELIHKQCIEFFNELIKQK